MSEVDAVGSFPRQSAPLRGRLFCRLPRSGVRLAMNIYTHVAHERVERCDQQIAGGRGTFTTAGRCIVDLRTEEVSHQTTLLV